MASSLVRAVLYLIAFAFSASAAGQTLKIGTPLALSGALAEEGKKQQAAYALWLERVNAAGGIDVGGRKMKVELVHYDYQTDEKRAQQLAERLITQDRVHFMTAPFGSGHTKVVAGVAERYGVPIVAVASSEPVHNQGYKNLFGTLAPSIGLIDAMIGHFRERLPGLKRVAILGRDDVFPKIMATSLSAQAKKAGLQVVYEGLYPVGTLDHLPALTAIKSAGGADWIYVTGYSKDLILVRKQMADLKLEAPIVTMITGPAYKEFIDGLGPLAENVTSATWWHWSTAYNDDLFGSTAAFTEAVRKKTGGDPDYVHASSAAALIVLQKAIEKAGSLDRDKVREALRTLDITTFYGPVKFRDDGMNSNRNLPIIQVQAGKPVVLYPAELRQATLRLNQTKLSSN